MWKAYKNSLSSVDDKINDFVKKFDDLEKLLNTVTIQCVDGAVKHIDDKVGHMGNTIERSNEEQKVASMSLLQLANLFANV